MPKLSDSPAVMALSLFGRASGQGLVVAIAPLLKRLPPSPDFSVLAIKANVRVDAWCPDKLDMTARIPGGGK